MPKKVLFLTAKIIDSFEKDGIAKKIWSQKSAWEELGFGVDLFFRSSEGIRGNINEKPVVYNGFFIPRIFMLIWSLYTLRKQRYEILYLRNLYTEMNVVGLLFFLIFAKKITKKIVLEIPTYPYFNEVKGFKCHVYLLIYKLLLPLIKIKTDLIVFMGRSRSEIWGVPALRLVNCVNLNNITFIPFKKKSTSEVIKFVGVAALDYWHGYDRLIQGLAQDTDYSIEFHIVGKNEPELSRIKKIADDLNVLDRVIFHGELSTAEINKLFETMDVGVDSLGRHRSGLDYNCSIKSKEYTARNIPFIKSHDDDSFNHVDFVYTVSANESLIDIGSVLDWFFKLELKSECAIREHAIENFVWEKQFEKILNNL